MSAPSRGKLYRRFRSPARPLVAAETVACYDTGVNLPKVDGLGYQLV
jgi:hypothetical protein